MRLNQRLSKIEAALPAEARPGAMWYHVDPQLPDFAIFMECRGFSLSNAEFCNLAGLSWPIRLRGEDLTAYLVERAGVEPPTRLDSAEAHFVEFWQGQGVKREIAHLVGLATVRQRTELTEWIDAHRPAGWRGWQSKPDGFYSEGTLFNAAWKHLDSDFIQSWLSQVGAE